MIAAAAMPEAVAKTYAGYPEAARRVLETVRSWTYEEAARTGAGPLTETLKWGEPAYLTGQTRSGTTLRLAWTAKAPGEARVLVHCQTSLVAEWRERFGDRLGFDGHRAICLPLDAAPPEDSVRLCIAMALTYHRPRGS